MAIIKKFIERRRKRLEEEARETGSLNFIDSGLPETDKPAFMRGYEIAYISQIKEQRNWRALDFIWKSVIILPLLTGLIIQRDNLMKHYPSREQKIINFYQKNGTCPSDATPAYLDYRVQRWAEEVEK